jgi:hypothetical protein
VWPPEGGNPNRLVIENYLVISDFVLMARGFGVETRFEFIAGRLAGGNGVGGGDGETNL